MSRFPKDCWGKKCPHFHVWDMSIDDLCCRCDLLQTTCDAIDEGFSILECPLKTENEFIKFINEYGGIDKFRCFAQMDMCTFISSLGVNICSLNKTTWVECRIDEWSLVINDNYNIILHPVSKGFMYKSLHQYDFMSLVKSGFIIPKTDKNQKVEHIRALEPLCGDAVIIHEFDIVQ